MHGQHKQSIQVYIIFNYSTCSFWTSGQCLYESCQNTPFWRRPHPVCFSNLYKTHFPEVQMNNVVKYDVYLNILIVVSLYVIRGVCETHIILTPSTWKWGSEQHFMPPPRRDWQDPWMPGLGSEYRTNHIEL